MDTPALFEPEVANEPFALFRRWLDEATLTELNDPNAMSLATADAHGVPSVRVVLMKRLDERGFAFYTNAESQKGQELIENQHAALCFHWKSNRRQVRVQGTAQMLPADDADTYFHSRSRKSQISAAVSQQSRPLESRELLERRAKEYAEQYPDVIPRPGYWRGFVVWPQTIEFWQDGEHRLHDRIVFHRDGETWSKERLYP